MGEVGVEPTRALAAHWILSPVRLPFRHSPPGDAFSGALEAPSYLGGAPSYLLPWRRARAQDRPLPAG